MPKQATELTALAVRNIKAKGWHAVGGVTGLGLQVAPSGARSWILRIVVGAKRRNIGLGGFPTVTLQMARDKARVMREQIAEGTDPVHARLAKRAELAQAVASAITFKAAAEQYMAQKLTEFKSESNKAIWRSTLEQYAYPIIGRVPASAIDMQHVLSVLEPIWHTKTATAKRLRQRIENVLAWATVKGYRNGDNAARWEGHLSVVLPAPNKISKTSHRDAMPYEDVPAFMHKLAGIEQDTAKALRLIILLAARAGEVCSMRWEDLDLDAGLWTIPSDQMKAGREHVVPLPQAAVDIIRSMPKGSAPYVFTARRFKEKLPKPMTVGGVYKLVKAHAENATTHGFRSSFKDWARTSTQYADEVSELALAHVSSDQTRAAYARDMLLEQRRALMHDWAVYCNTEENP